MELKLFAIFVQVHDAQSVIIRQMRGQQPAHIQVKSILHEMMLLHTYIAGSQWSCERSQC